MILRIEDKKTKEGIYTSFLFHSLYTDKPHQIYPIKDRFNGLEHLSDNDLYDFIPNCKFGFQTIELMVKWFSDTNQLDFDYFSEFLLNFPSCHVAIYDGKIYHGLTQSLIEINSMILIQKFSNQAFLKIVEQKLKYENSSIS